MNDSKKFIKLETISAKLLLSATLLALFVCNSSLYSYYDSLFHASFFVQLGNIKFKSNLLFWINEGLMTIFFLVVGLEIKYEIVKGSLNSLRKAALPGIGAIGGMIAPAIIYICINHRDNTMLRGWAAPIATDIAFSLAILSLLGSKVHSNLKAFLTALAIFDDIAAIIIIALFYTEHLSIVYLGLSFICIFILFILNNRGVTQLCVYTFFGFVLWFYLLKSGVHATLAGVILALMIPIKNRKNPDQSPLQKLQNKLHPWVALVVLPLFAFSNAGISFLSMSTDKLHITIILGALIGLFIGKQLGIYCASWIAVKLRLATLPHHIRWSDLYAIAIICGIGFTISLFIGSLAFNDYDENYLNSIKIGVLTGSLLSGIVGYILLLLKDRRLII